MNLITKTLPLAALALGLTVSQAAAFVAKRAAPPAPPESYQGQWYITADGCSYSRATAPGYGTMWVLIQNPYHIGQAAAPLHCATILQAGR